MNRLFYFLFSLLTALVTQAQPTPTKPAQAGGIGKIAGRVMVQHEGRDSPVPFANVVALKLKDSTLVAGALADGRGNFEITQLPLGEPYTLQIQAIGVETTRRGKYLLTARQPELEAGNLLVDESENQLAEVTVQGEKDPIEFQLNKRVYNLKQNLTTQGGTVIDALQTIPSVTVDPNGSVQLRGSERVMVLIDGKPSSITGNDRQAVLTQIPASMVERIEVITSPSARYDAENAAGIINILTKQNQKNGLNAVASLTVGNRDKYNSSVNLAWRQNRWGFVLSYDQLHDRRYVKRDADRRTFGPGINTVLTEREYLDGYTNSHNLKAGVDYALSSRKTLSATTLLKLGSGYGTSTNPSRLTDPVGQPIRLYSLNSLIDQSESGQDFTLGYRQTFPKAGQEWTIDLVYLRGDSQSNVDIDRQNYEFNFTQPDGQPTSWQNNLRNQFYTFTAQTDYGYPLAKIGKLESGLKTTLRSNDSDFRYNKLSEATGSYLNDPRLSNRFVFTEAVFAGYATLSNQYKKLTYAAGLRAEQTHQQGDQPARSRAIKRDSSYLNLFPSANLSYSLSEKQRLQLGYTRRINRPAYATLNPFVNYSNPQNLLAGNPALKPELVNSLEVSHLAFTKKGSVSSTLFYRHTQGQVARIRTLVDTLRAQNITVMTFDNVANKTTYGLELVTLQTLTKFWRLNAAASVFRTEFQGDNRGEIIQSAFQSFTARLINTFQFGKGWEVQAFGVYRSPIPTVQGRVKDVYFVDLGAKKDVLKGKGTINVRVSDVFNTFKFNVEVQGSDFFMNNPLKRETRVGFIGFTYRFSQKFKPSERRERKAVNEGRAGEGEN